MAAIPVPSFTCGSYNYFECWYKIITHHKTAPMLADVFPYLRHIGVWACEF